MSDVTDVVMKLVSDKADVLVRGSDKLEVMVRFMIDVANEKVKLGSIEINMTTKLANDVESIVMQLQ